MDIANGLEHFELADAEERNSAVQCDVQHSIREAR